MNLNKNLMTKGLIVVILMIMPSFSPLKAVSQDHKSESQGILSREKEAGGGRNWDEIEVVFLNKSGGFEREKRTGGSRGTRICLISPQSLVDIDKNNRESPEENITEIWSDRPLFIWQTYDRNPKQIILYSLQYTQEIWSQKVSIEPGYIRYNGSPLKSGKIYHWHLQTEPPLFQESSSIPFKIMDAEKREKMTQEIQEIEQKFKGESDEKVALEKAKYFINNNLWSDALQVMFLVSNPSPDLQQAINQIKSHNFCPSASESSPESSSRPKPATSRSRKMFGRSPIFLNVSILLTGWLPTVHFIKYIEYNVGSGQAQSNQMTINRFSFLMAEKVPLLFEPQLCQLFLMSQG